MRYVDGPVNGPPLVDCKIRKRTRGGIYVGDVDGTRRCFCEVGGRLVARSSQNAELQKSLLADKDLA